MYNADAKILKGEFRKFIFCIMLYKMGHEKPALRLVDQRGRRSRTLYRELNKCKYEYKLLSG